MDRLLFDGLLGVLDDDVELGEDVPEIGRHTAALRVRILRLGMRRQPVDVVFGGLDGNDLIFLFFLTKRKQNPRISNLSKIWSNLKPCFYFTTDFVFSFGMFK